MVNAASFEWDFNILSIGAVTVAEAGPVPDRLSVDRRSVLRRAESPRRPSKDGASPRPRLSLLAAPRMRNIASATPQVVQMLPLPLRGKACLPSRKHRRQWHKRRANLLRYHMCSTTSPSEFCSLLPVSVLHASARGACHCGSTARGHVFDSWRNLNCLPS